MYGPPGGPPGTGTYQGAQPPSGGVVAGVRDGEGFGKAVVGDGETKEFGSDGVGFGVVLVEGRETRDKKVEVGADRILHAKVVND